LRAVRARAGRYFLSSSTSNRGIERGTPLAVWLAWDDFTSDIVDGFGWMEVKG
jgi:hypothetical protein